MMKRNFTTLISELTQDERESVKEKIKMLSLVGLRPVQARLQRYEAGEDTAHKLLADMRILQSIVEEVRADLIKAHGFKEGGAK